MSNNLLSAQAERLHLARTGKMPNWPKLVATMNEIHAKMQPVSIDDWIPTGDHPVLFGTESGNWFEGIPSAELQFEENHPYDKVLWVMELPNPK